MATHSQPSNDALRPTDADQPTEAEPVEAPRVDQPTDTEPVEAPRVDQPTDAEPVEAPRVDQPRCAWAGGPGPMRDYHDTEWGVAVTGEAAYLERLTLEAFQSGLSWSTILAKRPAFRRAFLDFDADAVAAFTPEDEERLMQDAGIVRNRRKIAATVVNARATVALRADGGLEALVLAHAPTRSVDPAETVSAESVALSKELKRRGFTFVGPTTMHALMQALGLFDPHEEHCFRRGSRYAR